MTLTYIHIHFIFQITYCFVSYVRRRGSVSRPWRTEKASALEPRWRPNVIMICYDWRVPGSSFGPHYFPHRDGPPYENAPSRPLWLKETLVGDGSKPFFDVAFRPLQMLKSNQPVHIRWRLREIIADLLCLRFWCGERWSFFIINHPHVDLLLRGPTRSNRRSSYTPPLIVLSGGVWVSIKINQSHSGVWRRGAQIEEERWTGDIHPPPHSRKHIRWRDTFLVCNHLIIKNYIALFRICMSWDSPRRAPVYSILVTF